MENKYGKRYFTKKRTKEALILYISEKIFEEKFLKEAKHCIAKISGTLIVVKKNIFYNKECTK